MKSKIKVLVGIAFIAQTLFIMINFIYLQVMGGSMPVQEHNEQVLVFEVVANCGMMVFAMVVTSWFWWEYVKELKAKKLEKTE